MLRTDRKTEPTRETAKEQKTQTRQKSRESERSPAAALEALLAGADAGQIPAERLLELSQTLGNSALLELIAARQTGPETGTRPLPEGSCVAAPASWDGGAPALTEAPAFAGMAPMGAPAPLAV